MGLLNKLVLFLVTLGRSDSGVWGQEGETLDSLRANDGIYSFHYVSREQFEKFKREIRTNAEKLEGEPDERVIFEMSAAGKGQTNVGNVVYYAAPVAYPEANMISQTEGTFRAPISGFYIIQFSTGFVYWPKTTTVKLYKGMEAITGAGDNPMSDHRSGLIFHAITHLCDQEPVFVKLEDGQLATFSSNSTIFTGELIKKASQERCTKFTN